MRYTPLLNDTLQSILDRPLRVDDLRDETLFCFYVLERSVDALIDGLPRLPLLGKERQCLRNLKSETRGLVSVTSAPEKGNYARDAWRCFSALLDEWSSALNKERAITALKIGEIAKKAYDASKQMPSKPSENKAQAAMVAASGVVDAANSAMEGLETVDGVRQAFLDRLASARDEIRQLAEDAADDLGWTDEEIPFGRPLDSAQRLSRARDQNDLEVLKPHWESTLRRQPRNPFAIGDFSRANGAFEEYESGLKVVRQWARSALLIPEAAEFNRYRSAMVYDCIVAARQTASYHPYGKFYGLPPAPIAVPAAALADHWSTDNEFAEDPNYDLFHSRTHLLGLAGRQREGYSLALTKRDRFLRDRTYAYNVACLAGATGETQACYEWLRWVIAELGYSDIAHARIDPDFTLLRRDRLAEFEELTSVRCAVGIRKRTWSESIVLKNESRFWLTNVVLKCVGPESGGIRRPGEFRWDAVRPGEAVEHPSMSFRELEFTKVPFTLTCDQGTASSEGGNWPALAAGQS